MKYNPNKAISADKNHITVVYTDTKKHYNISYEKSESPLKDLQLHGNKFLGKSYQKIGYNESPMQHRLYRIALYGISVFTPEEVAKMSFKEKTKIITNQKKAQTLLDRWKQEICHKKLANFLNIFFGKSTLAKELAEYPDYIDQDNKNVLSFKDLGITKDMIIKKLILANLLPKDYYQLI